LSFSEDGWLELTYNAPSETYIQFDLGVDAVAQAKASTSPVPAPSALLLLCSGVIGLMAFKRRR